VQLFFLAILIAGMLVTAAITFTFCAAFPALRRFAITAPAASLVIAPVLLLIAVQSGVLMHHAFIVESHDPFRIFLVGALEVLVVVLVFTLAWAFALFCRGVLEYGPPLLNKTFGLQLYLLLQIVLLIGALASAIVDLVLFATLARSWYPNLAVTIGCGLTGLSTVLICLRPLLRLRSPIAYQPKPIPSWLKSILFRKLP